MAEAVREEDIDPLEPSATPVVIPSEADIRAIGNASEAAAMASHLASLAQNFSLSPGQRAMLLNLMALATQRETEIKVEESAASSVATPLAVLTPFEKAVFSFMSEAEKRYFESIDPNAQYETTMVDENDKRVTVSGDQLRKDLITITENSLPPEKREELEDLKTPEEKAQTPKSPKERLERTQEALERLKSRKDREVEEALEKGKITSEEAEKRLEKNDEAFKKAQENIGKAKEAHQKKKYFDDTPSPFQGFMQNATEKDIKATEENVRESLKEVREVMAEDPAAKPVAQKPERETAIQLARGNDEGHGLAVRAPTRSVALQVG